MKYRYVNCIIERITRNNIHMNLHWCWYVGMNSIPCNVAALMMTTIFAFRCSTNTMLHILHSQTRTSKLTHTRSTSTNTKNNINPLQTIRNKYGSGACVAEQQTSIACCVRKSTLNNAGLAADRLYMYVFYRYLLKPDTDMAWRYVRESRKVCSFRMMYVCVCECLCVFVCERARQEIDKIQIVSATPNVSKNSFLAFVYRLTG